MRNLKRYLAIALVVTMLCSLFVTNSVAISVTSADEAATTLNGLGLYKGISEGSFNPDLGSTLNRQTAVTMLLRLAGVEQDALDMTLEDAKGIVKKFTDASRIADWAVKQVAYAVDNQIVNGFPDGTFQPEGLLTVNQWSTLLLKQLGYDVPSFQNASVQFATTASVTAEELATFGTPTGVMKKSVLIGMSFKALDTKMSGSTTTLMGSLVDMGLVDGQKATAAGFPVETTTPTVAPTVAPTGEATVTPTSVPVSVYGTATEVKEVKITAQDTMVVVFNGAFEDTSKVTFEVTGPMTVTNTVTWNTEKTEATLKNTSVLLDGLYTVKAVTTGLTEGKDSATVNVVANGIAKIEILGDKLIRTSDDGNTETGTGFFYVKLTDTYGADVTATKAYDVTMTFSKSGTLDIDAETGKVEVTRDTNDAWDNYPAVPEMVTVTVYSNTVAGGAIASASKALTVSEQSRVQDIELGAVTFPGSSTQVLTEKDPAGYIAITAKDQFGYEVTDENRLEDDAEIVYSVSDSDVEITPEEYSNDAGIDTARLVVSTTALTDAKKVIVSAISKYKGKVSNQVTLDVKVPKAVEKITLGTPAKTMAVGDTYDDVLILPLTAFDAAGKQLTTDEVVSAYNAGNIVCTVSGYDAEDLVVEVATSGDNKGKIVSTLNDTSDGDNAPGEVGAIDRSQITLVVDLDQSTTMPTVTKLLSIKDMAYAVSIKLDTMPSTKLLSGANTKFNYKFIDQYGREMDDGMLAYAGTVAGNATTDHQTAVKLTATFPSGSDATFTVADNTNIDGSTDDVANTKANGGFVTADPATLSEYSAGNETEIVLVDAESLTADDAITFTAGSEDGTVKLKAELYKEYDLESITSTLTTSFVVVDGMPTDLTYSIEDVHTLYAYDSTEAMDEDFNGTVADDDYGDSDGTDEAAELAAQTADFEPGNISATEFADLTFAEAAHVRQVKLVAKDASGNSYAIPTANILSVNSSDTDVAHVLKVDNDDAAIDVHDDTVVVYGTDAAFEDEELPSSATKTAVITVVVSTDEGAVEVTKTVTVSNEAPKVAKVVITDADQLTTDPYSVEGDVITDLAGDETALQAEEIHVLTLDQFGVYTDVGDTNESGTVTAADAVVTLKVVNTNRYANTTELDLDTNNINIDTNKIVADEKVYLMYTAASGVKGQFSITSSAGIAALDSTAPTAPTAVAITPVGGTVVANKMNGTNTYITATANITAGQATGGYAQLLVGSTVIATDATVLVGDTTVAFTTSDGSPTTGELQALVTAGGTVTVKLFDAAGNSSTSSVSNPTLVRDIVAPTLNTVALADGSVGAGLAIDDTITLTFSEAMTVTGNTTFAMTNGVITIQDTTTFTPGTAGTDDGTGTIAWSVGNTVATLTFTVVTGTGSALSGTFTPGVVVLKDVAGNLLSTEASSAATGSY